MNLTEPARRLTMSLAPKEPHVDGLESGDGGGDGLEARVAVLEAHVTHIRDDLSAIKADIREYPRRTRAAPTSACCSAL